MNIGGGSWNAAVAEARRMVEEGLRAVAEIQTILPAQEYDFAIQFTMLEKLHAEEPWPSAAYVAKIESLIEAAMYDPAAYQALKLHAASLDRRKCQRIPQLGIFAREVLSGQRRHPPARGTPKVHPSRDPIIYAVLHDVAEIFGVPPTRNKASTSRISACDIVAAAMPNKPRLPKSYAALERIWIKGQSEDEDELLELLLWSPKSIG